MKFYVMLRMFLVRHVTISSFLPLNVWLYQRNVSDNERRREKTGYSTLCKFILWKLLFFFKLSLFKIHFDSFKKKSHRQ